ncbi:hypothetical protein PARMER_01018 [Parabacteroides merdae ATCC 43184]|nr:hypothetical protein PARMER_01018 [Parabacteroides merdae ATCC 43184]
MINQRKRGFFCTENLIIFVFSFAINKVKYKWKVSQH